MPGPSSARVTTDIDGFGDVRPAWLQGLSFYEASAVLGAIAFGAIYLSLAYLTFVYKWPGSTAGPVRVANEGIK